MSKVNANINGLKFEQKTRLLDTIKKTNLFKVEQLKTSYGKKVAPSYCFGNIFDKKTDKHIAKVLNALAIYDFLNIDCNIKEKEGVDAKKLISKGLKPDEVLINYIDKRIYIIEKKYQEKKGSVDEKLQTIEFKLQQYNRLFRETEFVVRYMFLLDGKYFNKKIYNDHYKFIINKGCEYYFDEIPLERLGLYAG